MSFVRKEFEELPSIASGTMKLLRSDVGITSFGIQVVDMPPETSGFKHNEEKSGQEELYVGLAGSGWLEIDGERVELAPRVAVAVTPESTRQTVAGPDGLSFIAIGGVPGKPYEVPEFFR